MIHHLPGAPCEPEHWSSRAVCFPQRFHPAAGRKNIWDLGSPEVAWDEWDTPRRVACKDIRSSLCRGSSLYQAGGIERTCEECLRWNVVINYGFFCSKRKGSAIVCQGARPSGSGETERAMLQEQDEASSLSTLPPGPVCHQEWPQSHGLTTLSGSGLSSLFHSRAQARRICPLDKNASAQTLLRRDQFSCHRAALGAASPNGEQWGDGSRHHLASPDHRYDLHADE